MAKCCGHEHHTRYCPDCGKRLYWDTVDELIEIKEYLEAELRHFQPYRDNPERFKRWIDVCLSAREELVLHRGQHHKR